MSKSILCNDKRCIYCGKTEGIHRHHIFEGTANRKKSEQYGCWCWLCPEHHNMSYASVHQNPEMNKRLKQVTQRRWEEEYGTREEFIQTFGKSYL